MKQDKQVGYKTDDALKKAGTNNQRSKSVKTEDPIAEKDEVKQAEDDLRNRKTKPIKRKLRIL